MISPTASWRGDLHSNGTDKDVGLTADTNKAHPEHGVAWQ